MVNLLWFALNWRSNSLHRKVRKKDETLWLYDIWESLSAYTNNWPLICSCYRYDTLSFSTQFYLIQNCDKFKVPSRGVSVLFWFQNLHSRNIKMMSILFSCHDYWWNKNIFKDGAYYCYCAYVLRISRHSDFLSEMLTNTGIFLRGLKLSGESRS